MKKNRFLHVQLSCTCTAAFIFYRVMAYNGVMVLISNSSLTETRGTVNGYAQALSAVGRSLGPVVGATAFAWSENTGMV